MAETDKPAAAKKQTKGGRKGGTTYPHLNLQKALDYGKKLVAKTHTGPQPEETILPGVFGNSGPLGKVRASALKQYGLLEGGVEAYQATQLAKDIDGALYEERQPLLERAFRASKLFNEIFDTFHGDTVSKARIEQRAKGLEVHPESADECAQLFIDSAITAGLGKMEGESIVLVNAAVVAPAADNGAGDDAKEAARAEAEASVAAKAAAADRDREGDKGTPSRVNKPGLSVSINVDSTSDPDKLEKQLKLLRDYGVI
jgi:hypothetical protein